MVHSNDKFSPPALPPPARAQLLASLSILAAPAQVLFLLAMLFSSAPGA